MYWPGESEEGRRERRRGGSGEGRFEEGVVGERIFFIKRRCILYQQMQKYEIMSAIGEGAYGVVLKCRDVENQTSVAIKKFKDADDDELTRKTTMRQVKILKMLSHENIVEMKEAFRKKGIVYLVFEYVENNLLEVLEKSPSGLHPNIIRKLMHQLLRGLAYLHQLDIVHRDIKPENLLVSSHYDLKICDFGFARQTRKEKGEVEMTDYVATRWYRPPQLLVGGDYSREIDMWAVGCIMCELIDGNPLFPGENELDQLFLIQKTLGPLPAELHERFVKNQRFLGMKFPDIQNLDPIDKKYFGKIEQKGLAFIKALLRMDPKDRLTAEEALNHPYFQSVKSRTDTAATTDIVNPRKEIYTSTTNRKRERDYDVAFDKATKYGKIYNKRKTNYNAIAMIYQSSNNCKMHNQYQSKSVGKGNKKMTTYNQNISLEKHHNKDILLKTEAKGFYIEGGDQLAGYCESPRKNDIGWQSTSQLPFLLMTGEQKPQGKRKPQIVIQKSYNTRNGNGPSNFQGNLASNFQGNGPNMRR